MTQLTLKSLDRSLHESGQATSNGEQHEIGSATRQVKHQLSGALDKVLKSPVVVPVGNDGPIDNADSASRDHQQTPERRTDGRLTPGFSLRAAPTRR